MSDENATTTDGKPKKNVGGRPRKDVTKTPEFKSAVAAGIEAALPQIQQDIVAQITARLGEVRGTPVAAVEGTADSTLIQELTKSIMAMVNGNKPRQDQPLTPQQLADREAGRARLTELLVPVQAADYDGPDAPEAPYYRVVEKTFLTDFVVEPYEVDPGTKAMVPKTIHWTGIPNKAMLPINDLAKEIYAAYQQAIGEETPVFDDKLSPKYAAQDGRPYGVTMGGAVVKGLNPSARRTVGALPEGSTTDVMGIRGQNDPRAPRINVLGTIADPAVANDARAAKDMSRFSGRLTA